MFTGIDDITAKQAAGQQFRADFFKLSGAAAHVAGNAYDFSLNGGVPFANAYPGTALAATVPNDVTGWGIYHGGNVSPNVKHALVTSLMGVGTNAAPGIALLVDVALYYPGVDLRSTALQTMNNTNTLARHTNGLGLRPYVVCTVQSGGTPAGTPVLSVFNYRNQSDVDSALTGVGTINFTAGAAGIPPVSKLVHCAPAANHPGPYLPLNAGNTGIKRVNTFQLSTAYTGSTTTTAAIVLAKPVLSMPLSAVGSPAERNMLTNMPPIADGACLTWLYFPGAATAANSAYMGHIDTAWG